MDARAVPNSSKSLKSGPPFKPLAIFAVASTGKNRESASAPPNPVDIARYAVPVKVVSAQTKCSHCDSCSVRSSAQALRVCLWIDTAYYVCSALAASLRLSADQQLSGLRDRVHRSAPVAEHAVLEHCSQFSVSKNVNQQSAGTRYCGNEPGSRDPANAAGLVRRLRRRERRSFHGAT